MAPAIFVRLIKATLHDWSEDKVPRAAAALAYYAMFSLAPLLLIAIGIAGIVFGHEQAQTQILAQATSLVGEKGAQAIEMMMGARSQGQQTGVISTVVGAVALLFGAAGVLAQLKDTLNTVWDVKAPKNGVETRINLYRCQGKPADRNYINWQTVNNETFHTPEAFGRLRLDN